MPLRPAKPRLQVSLREALNWIIRDTFEPDFSSEPAAPATAGAATGDAGGAFSDSPDEAAKEQLIESLYGGEIVATGRIAAPVELLDKRARRKIPARFWGYANVNWDESFASGGGESYDNIALSRDGVTALWSRGESDSAEGSTDSIADAVHNGPDADSGYTAPYLELMRRAIEHFEITETHQPMTKELEDWFVRQSVNGKEVSDNLARAMATLVRLPESQRGGIRRNYRRKNSEK